MEKKKILAVRHSTHGTHLKKVLNMLVIPPFSGVVAREVLELLLVVVAREAVVEEEEGERGVQSLVLGFRQLRREVSPGMVSSRRKEPHYQNEHEPKTTSQNSPTTIWSGCQLTS